MDKREIVVAVYGYRLQLDRLTAISIPSPANEPTVRRHDTGLVPLQQRSVSMTKRASLVLIGLTFAAIGPGFGQRESPASEYSIFSGYGAEGPVIGWFESSFHQQPAAFNFCNPPECEEVTRYGSIIGDGVPFLGAWRQPGVLLPALFDQRSGTITQFGLDALQRLYVASVIHSPYNGLDVVPIAGDWDGDGSDTVGLHVPDLGGFVLFDQDGNGTFIAMETETWALPVAVEGAEIGTERDGLGLYEPERKTLTYLEAADASMPSREWQTIVEGDVPLIFKPGSVERCEIEAKYSYASRKVSLLRSGDCSNFGLTIFEVPPSGQ